MSEEMNKIVLFRSREIRKQLHEGEWWFAINDIVGALVDTDDPAHYLTVLRSRDSELKLLLAEGDKKGGSQIETPLLLTFDTAGGKQKLKSWNVEGIFRLIQSIPSKKAEQL